MDLSFSFNQDLYKPAIFEIDFFIEDNENLFLCLNEILNHLEIPSNHLIGIIDKGPIHNVSHTIQLAFSDKDSARKFILFHCVDDEWLAQNLMDEANIYSDYDED